MALKALEIAISLVILAREKKDLYQICYHAEGCDEWVWDDDGEALIDEVAAAEKECEACFDEWAIAARIIEETGSADYYDWAMQAFRDYDYLERFRLPPSEVGVWVYLNACAVQGEINKREKQLALQREAEANAHVR